MYLRRRSFARALCATVACCLLAAYPAVAAAQAPLTLEAAIREAQRANPDLAVARARLDSAHAERTIARAWPAVSLSSIPQSPWQYALSLPADVGPQRAYRSAAAAAGFRAADFDSRSVRLDVTFAVRQAFADVMLAETLREIARADRALYARVLAGDSARLAAGDVPVREVTKAEVELVRADAALARSDAQVHQARIALTLLLGRDAPDTALAIRGSLAYRRIAIPDSVFGAATRRPDTRAAAERLDQSRSLQRLATASIIPMPTLTVVRQDGVAFPNGSLYALGLGVQLPGFPFASGERERSRAGVVSAETSARRTRAQATADVAAALDAVRQAERQAERFESDLVARSASALAATEFAYRAGAAGFLDLVDAVRSFAAVRTDAATAQHDYWVALWSLERATGVEFLP